MRRHLHALAVTLGIGICLAAMPTPTGFAHPAKHPKNPWKQVSSGFVYSIDQPTVQRFGRKFEIAWLARAGSSDSRVLTRRYNARTGGAIGGTHPVTPAWAAINEQAPLISYQGHPAVVFAGIRNPLDPPGNPYDADSVYYATSPTGKDWTIQPGSLSHSTGVGASEGLAAFNNAGTPTAAFALSPNGWVTYHQGISSSTPAQGADGTTAHDTKCCVYDPSLGRDPKGGRLWTTWYSNSSRAGWNGINAEAIPSGKRHHAPGSSVSTSSGPASVSPAESPQIAARPHKAGGGLYTAYAIGYPSPSTIGVWKLGAAKTTLRIKAHHLVAAVGVAPATSGRLWVMWADRATGKVRIALTNRKVTGIDRIQNLPRASSTSYQADVLVGDGSKGRLNLVALEGGSKDQIFYTQVKP